MQIRSLALTDRVPIQSLIKSAFSGFPWFEDLSNLELTKRWEFYTSRPGFKGLVVPASSTVKIAGGHWWDAPSISELATERGSELAALALQEVETGRQLIWERDLVVHREFQGNGIARKLREAFLENIQAANEKILVLTRMRSDNVPTIVLAERLNFKRTGVRLRSSSGPDIFHEYWSWTN